jgi:hypothetical protein
MTKLTDPQIVQLIALHRHDSLRYRIADARLSSVFSALQRKGLATLTDENGTHRTATITDAGRAAVAPKVAS